MLEPERRAAFETLRREAVPGQVIALEPYDERGGDEHAEGVLAVRNAERAMHFLSQAEKLTREGQAKWFEGYLERDDDLQWVVRGPAGRVVGVTALYTIDMVGGTTAEKGRLAVDEEASRLAPIALEAELLLLDVAFGQLGLAEVFTRVRPDNRGMLSINHRLGFEDTGRGEIRGNEMVLQTLSAERYQPAVLRGVVRHWARRIERAAS